MRKPFASGFSQYALERIADNISTGLYGKCTEFPISTGRELLSAADDLAEWQTAREINPAAVVKIPVQDVVVNVPSTVPEERIST